MSYLPDFAPIAHLNAVLKRMSDSTGIPFPSYQVVAQASAPSQPWSPASDPQSITFLPSCFTAAEVRPAYSDGTFALSAIPHQLMFRTHSSVAERTAFTTE